jgi:Golgi apparatus protein 1
VCAPPRLPRRQANWRLDPPLRRACKTDVAKLCQAEDDQASEQGLVYKCLIKNAESVAPECHKELGRAVHMALFVWIPGSILTSPCDVDIADSCLKARPNMLHQTGEVAECLAGVVRARGGCGGGGGGGGRRRGGRAVAGVPSCAG